MTRYILIVLLSVFSIVLIVSLLSSQSSGKPLEGEYQVTKELAYDNYSPTAILDSEGYYDLAWASKTSSGSSVIKFSRSIDNSNWEETVLVTDNSYSNYYPQMAEGGGNLYLAFSMKISDHWDIYFTSSDDWGETWSSPTKVYGQSGYGETSFGIAANGNTVWIIFAQDNRRYSIKSTDGGSSWGNRVQICDFNSEKGSNVIINKNGDLIVPITRESDGLLYIYIDQAMETLGVSLVQHH